MRDVCSECGDAKPLNASGVCAWRHGCEHRQLVHSEAVARLLAELDHQAFHNTAREAARRRHPASQDPWPGESYDGTSLLDTWRNHPSGTPERTNYWIDQWLNRDQFPEEES